MKSASPAATGRQPRRSTECSSCHRQVTPPGQPRRAGAAGSQVRLLEMKRAPEMDMLRYWHRVLTFEAFAKHSWSSCVDVAADKTQDGVREQSG